MRIIKINALDNGAHDNLTINDAEPSVFPVPDGWAVIPDSIAIPNTFPFVNIEVNGQTVTAMTAGAIPEPETPSPAKQREEAYNTQAVIAWDGSVLTVTEAAQKWQYYAAEGSTEKTEELTSLIASAKQSIRAQYPDE